MDSRRWFLLLSLLIIAAVAILSASLHDVHFLPGKPFGVENTAPPPVSDVDLTEMVVKPPLWKVLLFWLAFVINVVLFFWLLPPDVRKRILRQVISIVLGSLAIVLALRYKLIQLPFLEGPPHNETILPGTGGGNVEPPPVFSPPHMTPWWIFAVGFLVLTVLLLGLWLVYRWWLGQAVRRGTGLDAIGAIARSSLSDLAAGRQWNDVIIQSYMRMSEVVRTRRGLQRAQAVTPREFAQRLQEAGLPAQAVQRLTRLFESARYGGRAATQTDINEAVACLNSILLACGQTL